METTDTKRKEHINVLKFFTKLSLQIVILFAIAICYSYLTEYLQTSGFFGDVRRPTDSPDNGVDSAWDWGTRHYLFFSMSILLFIVQFIRIIVFGMIEGAHTFDNN